MTDAAKPTVPTLDIAAERVRSRFVTAGNNPRTPTADDKAAVEEFTNLAMQLGFEIESRLGDSRLKSLALTNLEEALTWANKAAWVEGAAPRG